MKLQIERRMSYKLETANCTPQYLSQKNGCLCEARTHDLHIRARHSSDETSYMYIELILFGIHSDCPDSLFTSGKYIHENNPVAPIIVFVVQKRKKLSM